MRTVKYHLLSGYPNARTPSKAHATDAGYDLFVAEDRKIFSGQVVDIPTGVALELPDDVWAMLTGRSSTIRKRRLLVTTGIIDSGYRGELFFAIYNPGPDVQDIKVGDRLAQLLLFPHVDVTWQPSTHLAESERGDKGFGSTGE